MAVATIDLIQNIVSGNYSSAQAATEQAYRWLNSLATQQSELPLSIVDTTIGANAGVSWAVNLTPAAQPAEPDYSGDVPEAPTIPEVTVSIADAPAYGVVLTGAPDPIAAPDFSPVARLMALPEITAVTPTLSVAALTTDFSFSEPVYTERVTADVEAGILAALGGAVGLPDGYWDDLWTRVSNDFARQQAAALRNARNRGAASHWGLPGEPVLVASAAIADEGQRKLSLARLDQAQKQAEMAREDFWRAVAQGLAYEKVFLDFHHQVATRAFTAAEQLYGLRVQMHNANVQLFNASLEKAKADLAIQDAKVQVVLKRHESELRGNATEIEQDAAILKRWLGEWDGFKSDKTLQLTAYAEQIKGWMSTTDAAVKVATLEQAKSDLDLKRYTALLGQIDTLAKATAQVLAARVQAVSYDLEGQKAEIVHEERINALKLQTAQLTQAAQEAKARIDVAQAEWLTGQAVSITKALADNAFNMASTLVAGSNASLSASLSSSDSISASRNEETLW